MKIFSILLVGLLAAPLLSVAKIKVEDQAFEAIVSSVGSKTAKVVYRGRLWEVPKTSIVQNKNLKIGKRVDVVIPARQLASIKVTNPKPFKKK